MVKGPLPKKSNPIMASTRVPRAFPANDRSRTRTGKASTRCGPSRTLGAITRSDSIFYVKTDSFSTVPVRCIFCAIRRSRTLGTLPVSIRKFRFLIPPMEPRTRRGTARLDAESLA